MPSYNDKMAFTLPLQVNPASQTQPDRTPSTSFQMPSDLHLEAMKSYRTFNIPARVARILS
ncbi:hypothetical protein BDW68DRAFT_123573 [Aspergillus falconensis]